MKRQLNSPNYIALVECYAPLTNEHLCSYKVEQVVRPEKRFLEATNNWVVEDAEQNAGSTGLLLRLRLPTIARDPNWESGFREVEVKG